MPDYKAMYYYLAGQTAAVAEALEATTSYLWAIADKLKSAQKSTEDIFVGSDADDTPS